MSKDVGIKKTLQRIEKVAELYQNKYPQWLKNIGVMDKHELLNDDIKGLKWYVCQCFNRGRNDKISAMYAKCAHKVIDEFRKEITYNMPPEVTESIKCRYQNEVHKIPKKTKTGEFFEVNEKDIFLLEGIFQCLLPKISCINIPLWVVNSIKDGKPLLDIYEELKTKEVGDKLRGYTLRDIIWLFNLKEHLKEYDYNMLQPIDTWVRTVAEHIWNKQEIEHLNNTKLGEKLVGQCMKYGICPLKFSQGIWYIGRNSLECIFQYYLKQECLS